MTTRAGILLSVIVLILTAQAGKEVEPTALHIESIRYPDFAQKAQIQGGVEVEITISSAGEVSSATAMSGHPVLRRAAEENARKWRFNTNSVERHIQIRYEFVLEEPKTDYKPETRNTFDLPRGVRVASNMPRPQTDR